MIRLGMLARQTAQRSVTDSIGSATPRALELFRTMDVFTDAKRRQLFETTPARVWRFAGA
jgi:hypothetical protein